MSDTQWYVAVDGNTIGPLTEEELRQGFRAGTYGPRHHVYGPGMSEWATAESVQSFAQDFVATVSPPPPRAGRCPSGGPDASAPHPRRNR